MSASRKNLERMEEYVAGFSYESQQQFLSDSPWDDEGLRKQIALDVNKLIRGRDSALLIDESCFEKKGENSVGVARQWNGRLGKVENSQVAVFGALSNGKYGAIIDTRLYLLKCWTDDKQRCKKAGIPNNGKVEFKTKGELALEIIDQATEIGLNYGWTSMDGGYGDEPWLLRAINGRGIMFTADVHCVQRVYTCDPAPYIPEKKSSKGRQPSRLRTDAESITVEDFFNKCSRKGVVK